MKRGRKSKPYMADVKARHFRKRRGRKMPELPAKATIRKV